MSDKKRTSSLKWIQMALGIFLVISIGVFVIAGLMIQYRDLSETYKMAEETTAFVKAECQKFDYYQRRSAARSLQDLLDKADGLNKFVSEEDRINSEFLHDYIRTEHIGGVMILDRNMVPVAQADMDDQDSYALWRETLSKNAVKNILDYPEKTYIDHVILGEVPYDMAVIADRSGERLIFCYASTEKPSTDPYELTIKSVLTNNNFYKNPTLVITDGTKVLSTNNPVVEEQGEEQHQELASAIDWKDDWFTKFEYQNTTYYGVRRVYNTYSVYAVYASEDIFSHRTSFISFAFLVYLGVGIIILTVQRHYDKVSINRMEKQLRIINAISTAYNSTFLLHLDSMELEPIRPSERLKAIYEEHPKPYEFVIDVCKTEVAPDGHQGLMHFLDLDTVAERLQGRSYLEYEVQDSQGVWFSVLLIPQKYDENGKVQALLVTTRDITGVKQTEELTFKDKLTGLYNRNYMEARSRQMARSGDFPVSFIMADCNYLKRTNDTLGHEYGDLLLQRVANAITDSLSNDCVAMRVGGDEFLILCMHCTNQEAHRIVADIRQKLDKRSDEKLKLSAAFGVFTSENDTVSFEQAYKAADQAMYQDKKASRVER